ncbi:hypothetical protein H6P81_021418 [Aristolochia fimbriata]|uniref:Uncharacterized protein n=1 Tax=Aristolochia fimbriata TaxID=158543 RepID=A0AAV7DTP3_ARIFI|nr:hypothetical protein H6P81_021418 [Aristolochia fimbriata]
MAFSSSRAQGKAQVARATLLPNSSFLIFHALCGTVQCPSPDLDLPVRRLWRLCCFAMHAGGASAACGPRRACEWCALDMREWCFRPYEPSSRRAVFPSLHGPPAALLGRWHSPGAWAAQSGVSVYFPLRLSLAPGESDRPTFAFDRRCPWPGAGLFASACLASRSLRGCYLVDPASSHMLVSKIKPCMFKSFVVGPWVGSSVRLAVCTGRLRPFYGDALLALTGGSCLGAVTLKKLECSKQAYALDTLAWDNITGFRSYCVGRDRVMINEGTVGGIRRTTAKAFAKDVFINQERKLGARRRSDTVLVSTISDADQGSADVAFRTRPAPYEKSKFFGFGGVCMVQG